MPPEFASFFSSNAPESVQQTVLAGSPGSGASGACNDGHVHLEGVLNASMSRSGHALCIPHSLLSCKHSFLRCDTRFYLVPTPRIYGPKVHVCTFMNVRAFLGLIEPGD
jgi:hypothetical protein